MIQKKYFFYLAVPIFFLIIFILLIVIPAFIPKASPPTASPLPSVSKNFEGGGNPVPMEQIPTISSKQGGGVDLNSQIVKDSATEISKLSTSLPFEQELVLSTGQKVSIIIPSSQYQTNPWTLTAQIFGINYQTSSDQADYEQAKTSFLEASQKIFEWIRSHGANPDKIIISWGDKQYIQQNAETWLKSK